MIDIQIKYSLPGLATQLADHVSKLGNPQLASKWQWKRAVGSYIESLNKHQLLEKIKGYKKLNYDDICKEEFGRKSYFYNNGLDTVRGLFRLSSRMWETVRSDFPNKYRGKSLRCPSCRFIQSQSVNEQTNRQTGLSEEPRDSIEHLKNDCAAFIHLRSQYDLSDDVQLIQYFNAILDERKDRGED